MGSLGRGLEALGMGAQPSGEASQLIYAALEQVREVLQGFHLESEAEGMPISEARTAKAASEEALEMSPFTRETELPSICSMEGGQTSYRSFLSLRHPTERQLPSCRSAVTLSAVLLTAPTYGKPPFDRDRSRGASETLCRTPSTICPTSSVSSRK